MGAWALRREQLEWAGVDRAASLRRYALFLEGLLPNASRDIGYGRALQSGLLRLESEFDASPLADRRPNLLARLLRLRLYADSLGIIELDHSRAEFEAARVAEHQIQSSDPQLDGAFGAEPPETDVEMPAVVDPETAVVCLQALEMWRQVQDGGFRRGWHELI
jgi:hypothetical protein